MKKPLILLAVFVFLFFCVKSQSFQVADKNSEKQSNTSSKSNYYSQEEWNMRIENLIFTQENIENAYDKYSDLPKIIVTGNYTKDVELFWANFYAYIKKNQQKFPNLFLIVKEIEAK